MAEQQALEMILLRQLASYLAIPVWIMDEGGNLLFYNEPAEELLGVRFDDAGPIKAGDLAELWKVSDLDGSTLGEMDIPVINSLMSRQPAHRPLRYQSLDGTWHRVEVVAMPVQGQGDRFLGVWAAFWEPGD